jgi:hypothetical protein
MSGAVFFSVRVSQVNRHYVQLQTLKPLSPNAIGVERKLADASYARRVRTRHDRICGSGTRDSVAAGLASRVTSAGPAVVSDTLKLPD